MPPPWAPAAAPRAQHAAQIAEYIMRVTRAAITASATVAADGRIAVYQDVYKRDGGRHGGGAAAKSLAAPPTVCSLACLTLVACDAVSAPTAAAAESGIVRQRTAVHGDETVRTEDEDSRSHGISRIASLASGNIVT